MSKRFVASPIVAVLALLLSVVLVGPEAQAQTPTATPKAASSQCQGSPAGADASGNVNLSVSNPNVVTSVCLVIGTTSTGQIGNGNVQNCYTVTGVGSTQVRVTRVNTAATCNAQIFVQTGPPGATPTATATPAATATPVATSTATAAPTAKAATPVPAVVAPPKSGSGGFIGLDRTNDLLVPLMAVFAIAAAASSYLLIKRDRRS